MTPGRGTGGSQTDPGERTASRIARAIAREVAEDGLGPGTRLPDEKAMARAYGVGRSSVREALRLLEAQGLVELRRGVGGGPVVSRRSRQDLVRWSFDRVPHFAVPRYVEFRAELPKNPVQRVLKHQLRSEGVTATTWDRADTDIEVPR